MFFALKVCQISTFIRKKFLHDDTMPTLLMGMIEVSERGSQTYSIFFDLHYLSPIVLHFFGYS